MKEGIRISIWPLASFEPQLRSFLSSGFQSMAAAAAALTSLLKMQILRPHFTTADWQQALQVSLGHTQVHKP